MGLLSYLTDKRRRSHIDPVNIGSREFKADPFPFYARLRAEAPVYRVSIPTGEMAWLITRYNDVALVLNDARFIKNWSNAATPEQQAHQVWIRRLFRLKWLRWLQGSMLHLDPPDHARLRALVNKAFTPRLIEGMRERIRALADELLDKVQERGHMDLVRDYAVPIPTTIIAEILGVPVEDRHKFRRWSRSLFASSTWELMKAVPNIVALLYYIRRIIKQRRAKPRDDLVSVLAQVEQAGDSLTEEELLSMVVLLLVAGHETTANLIGNGALALLEHPDQMDRLRHEPALMKTAVEELLRYTSPVDMATERYAREDVTIAGVTIRRGEMVAPVLASANRDEWQFPNADVLDLGREPNKHLSFGLGTHFCLGAALARLEGHIAFSTLSRRAPDLRVAVTKSALRWRPGFITRGLEALPVAFGKTRSQALMNGPRGDQRTSQSGNRREPRVQPFKPANEMVGPISQVLNGN
jgi:cytochrome P450 PksS